MSSPSDYLKISHGYCNCNWKFTKSVKFNSLRKHERRLFWSCIILLVSSISVRHYVSFLLEADCKHFPEHLCLLRTLFPNKICGADYYKFARCTSYRRYRDHENAFWLYSFGFKICVESTLNKNKQQWRDFLGGREVGRFNWWWAGWWLCWWRYISHQ